MTRKPFIHIIGIAGDDLLAVSFIWTSPELTLNVDIERSEWFIAGDLRAED